MPLFNKKPSKVMGPPPGFGGQNYENNNSKTSGGFGSNVPSGGSIMNNEKRMSPSSTIPPSAPPQISKPQLVFHCQLAHGSPTGLISGFGSVKELYQKIGECYDFPMEEVH